MKSPVEAASARPIRPCLPPERTTFSVASRSVRAQSRADDAVTSPTTTPCVIVGPGRACLAAATPAPPATRPRTIAVRISPRIFDIAPLPPGADAGARRGTADSLLYMGFSVSQS